MKVLPIPIPNCQLRFNAELQSGDASALVSRRFRFCCGCAATTWGDFGDRPMAGGFTPRPGLVALRRAHPVTTSPDASHHRATSGIAVSDKACGAQTRSVLSHGDTKGALGLARFARSLVSSNQTIKQSKQSTNSLGRVEHADHVECFESWLAPRARR